MLTIFLKPALSNKPLVIFGDGQQIRDFIFVKDVVNMNMKCFENDQTSDQIFNVSTGKGTTINSLAETVKKISGRDIKILHENVQEGSKSKYSSRIRLPMELKTLIQSPKKAKKNANWTPQMKLENGILS